MVKRDRIKDPAEVLAEQNRISNFNKKFKSFKYQSTKSAKAGRFVTNVARGISINRSFGRAVGAGRPRGSYAPGYAAFGGVYGYRKALAAQLRAQRLEQERNAQLSPEEQVLLARAAAQRRASQTAPEYRTFPDTTGQFDFSAIQREIDDAANAVR